MKLLKMLHRVVVKAINGIFEWFTFFLQSGFPIFNLFLFGFACFCYHDEITGRLGANQGFYRCDCQEISVFSANYGEFDCSQAALLSYLTNNSKALIEGTTDGSFIKKDFDYKDEDTELPFFDCNMYDKMLKHDKISFNISKLVKLVENDAERIVEESEAICEDFPDKYLF